MCEQPADLWALGCIIYYILTKEYPFNSNTNYLIFERIKKIDVKFPEDFDELAMDICLKLFKREPYDRIGADGA